MSGWAETASTVGAIDLAPKREGSTAIRRSPIVDPLGSRHGEHAEAPLRVAVVAPPWMELPPDAYGGVESVCSDLVDALVDRGVEVTLLGPGRHATTAAFRPTGPVADPRLMGRALPEVVQAARLPELLADLAVDVVHDNTLAGPLVGATHGLPTVVTAHGPVHGDLGVYYRTISGRASLVALSRAQREHLPTARWAATVPNGGRPTASRSVPRGASTPLPGTDEPGQGPGVGHRGRARGGHPAGDGGQVPRGRGGGVLRARRGAAARRRRGVDRRGRRQAQGRAAGRRALSAVPHRLGGALRPGDDRGHGLRDPGGGLAPGRCPRWSTTDGRAGSATGRPSCPRRCCGHQLHPRDCRAAVEERFSAAVLAAGYERVYRRVAAAGRPPAASRPAS